MVKQTIRETEAYLNIAQCGDCTSGLCHPTPRIDLYDKYIYPGKKCPKFTTEPGTIVVDRLKGEPFKNISELFPQLNQQDIKNPGINTFINPKQVGNIGNDSMTTHKAGEKESVMVGEEKITFLKHAERAGKVLELDSIKLDDASADARKVELVALGKKIVFVKKGPKDNAIIGVFVDVTPTPVA